MHIAFVTYILHCMYCVNENYSDVTQITGIGSTPSNGASALVQSDNSSYLNETGQVCGRARLPSPKVSIVIQLTALWTALRTPDGF
jgi:hypothetical protein